MAEKKGEKNSRLKSLEKFLDAFDNEAVRADEMIQAIDTVINIIKQSQDTVFSKIDETDSTTKAELERLKAEINASLNQIDSQTKSLAGISATIDTVEKMREEVGAEIKRISSLIPELPDEFDATDIYTMIGEHKEMLSGLSELVIGENIRNALESLPDGEKLSQDAVEGLPQALERLQQVRQQTTALIARRLDQVADVDTAGVTNGQVLAYNSTTGLWEAATVAGTGDMTAAVYDPNTVASDAFSMTNMDATAWRVFYSNVTGDVTELALGADGTFLKSNGAAVAPTFETPTATVAALNDVGDVTITTPADNEVVAYNTGTGEFINQTAAEAGLQATLAEGAFVDGDKTKLDGIEALADVTDTANVTAAGALMDSEVDADIKTLSLPASTTISAYGATLVDDADAATARTTLDVDVAGTDNAPAASTTVAGKVELATDAEFTTGTDATRYVTADQVQGVAQTMENKRITERTGTTTSSATPTINTDNVDEYYITAQAADITSFTTNLSGTPVLGDTLYISIIGTAARAITWGASFGNGAVALPTTTVTTTELMTMFKWNGTIWAAMATGSTV